MSNDLAWRIGVICQQVAALDPGQCGDPIDRGLILVRTLKESGFIVSHDTQKIHKASVKNRHPRMKCPTCGNEYSVTACGLRPHQHYGKRCPGIVRK